MELNVRNYIKGNPKYKKEDLPLVATFVTKHKEHRIRIESIEEKTLPNGSVQRVKDTGCQVRFRDGFLAVGNKEVLEKLLAHKSYNVPNLGFFPDTDDITGFWASLGVVETVHVPVKKIVPNSGMVLGKDKKLPKDFISNMESAQKAMESSTAPDEELTTQEKSAYGRAKVKIEKGEALTPFEQTSFDKAEKKE